MKLICLLISFTLFSPLLLASQMASEAVTITKVFGSANIGKKKLKRGDQLMINDLLQVSKRSYVNLEFSNTSTMRVGPGEIKITASMSKKETVVSLIKGTIFTFVRGLAKNEKFIVKTKRASMGVRGTKFLAMEEGEDSYLCVCQGTVEASNLKGKKTLVNAGEDIHITDKGPFNKIKASKQMMDMGIKTFKEMGFPVKGYK